MNRAEISQAIGQIDLRFVQEAMDPVKSPVGKNETAGKERPFLTRYGGLCRAAAGFGAAVLVVSLAAATAFAASGTFRRAVISFLYPIYSTEELKELDQGHLTGSFDERDTLLSFLDRFNAEKMELGVRAENDDGYTYLLISDSPDSIIAVVDCSIAGYKLLVTMNRLDYEDTAGIWQAVSYQMVTEQMAFEMLKETPAYLPQETVIFDEGPDPAASVIQTEGDGAMIYRAEDKDNIITLTEEESGQIEEIFQGYEESNVINATGLQDRVVRYEDIMYAFSDNGYVIVMEGDAIGVPRGQILLKEEDLKILTELFEKYGL